ncbi:protein madd-4 isoform X1 [Euwallacea fornicatus]|uniref:protein madd-4 isoform X1 n=1 Tax=Euwallacea fornicatus TaxID=995702 RepID=UPI00338F9C9D
MEYLHFLLLMMSCFGSSCCGIHNNLTIPRIGLDFSSRGGDESESDLSSQLQKVETRTQGWAPWSQWSACSRSCDGGISHQLRTCKGGPCRGSHVRYQICNMQPCPGVSLDFREEQCASYNNVPYDGVYYDWFPFYDDDEPCTLICKGKLKGATDEVPLVVSTLKDGVQDGTRCRPGSLDMCIDGECQRVGCDLKLGSGKQIDECGICGGEGTTCAKPLYHWTLTYASLCSVSCGGGYKMSRPTCQNRISGEEVQDDLCNDSQKPDSTIVECNTHGCPPKWHVSDWGSCSTSCGGGFRLRQVFCVEEMNNTKIKVVEAKCEGRKPSFQESCNENECPVWVTTKWSGCSVSCGEGIQTRQIECRDEGSQLSDLCDEESRPKTRQECTTGIACTFVPDGTDSDDGAVFPDAYQPDNTGNLYQALPPMAEKLIGEQVVPSESTFVPDEWGPCSVSCGEGIRKREVHCKIFLEFSRTIAKLPDKQCSGDKPIEIEKCVRDPCLIERIELDFKDDPTNIKVGSGSPAKSYSWKEQGFTPCSASCLGGVQELIVNCVRDDTEKVTSPYMCPIELKPEIIIRACNEHSCPPRWSYTEFSPCSQSCGIGIQTRDVNCIHEITQGGSNTVIVPNNRCPQPPPPDRQYCNVLDCPVRWKVSDWSKCSKPCGGGEKSRKVDCKQVMAQNHTVDRLSTLCPTPKPLERKPCNTKSCVIESDKPIISVTNSTFIQHDPKKNKVTVKVGGAATLFTGTTVKIKCPVKRFDRSKILWKKDNTFLPQNKKFKSSKKGALRVQNLSLRDMGTYTCVAGKSAASISISIRPKPGEFTTSEEVQKQYQMDLIPNEHIPSSDGKPVYTADDQSHEQKPDSSKTKTFKFFTPTSSPSSLTLDGYAKSTPLSDQSGVIPNRNQDKISNLPSSSSELLNTPNYGDSRSSASRIMPNFLSLISKIQALWLFNSQPSRGHRMATFTVPEQIPATEHPRVTTPLNNIDNVAVGGMKRRIFKLEWKVSNWTACSESCGGKGLKTRNLSCRIQLVNASRSTEDEFCEQAKIPKPDSKRTCGFQECPFWSTSEWSTCESSKCSSLQKAMQKRLVRCQLSGNLSVNNNLCSFKERPSDKQECNNTKCVGMWKVSSWSQCNAQCGEIGDKYRTFHCVWYGTKKPAGDACKNVPKPLKSKPCRGPPCSKNSSKGCKDLSRYCTNVKTFNLCTVVRYKQQCCNSCRNYY